MEACGTNYWMFCCPLSRSLSDLLHIHVYTLVDTIHSSPRGHVIHHLCWCYIYGPVLGLAPVLDTNEIILCKYAVSLRPPPSGIAGWGCVVPQVLNDETVGVYDTQAGLPVCGDFTVMYPFASPVSLDSITVYRFLVLYLYVSHQFLGNYSDVLVLMWWFSYTRHC